MPQRDRIDRKSVEIIASELYSIYVNGTHLLSIARGLVFLPRFYSVRIADCRMMIIRSLTRVKEHDSFEKSKLRVVDLDLLKRFHQLVHHPDAHVADVQVLLIASSLWKLQWYY